MAGVDLFGARPRRARRVLMHVFDAGDAEAGNPIVRLLCKRCGFESEWLKCETVIEARKGKPCPSCNGK